SRKWWAPRASSWARSTSRTTSRWSWPSGCRSNSPYPAARPSARFPPGRPTIVRGSGVEAKPAELRRVLGLWDAVCVVVGAIIGVGIFFNPRDVAHVTGSAGGALAAWAVGGLVALLGALTFAELGRLRPFAGGQYHVLRDAYGRAP